MLFSKSVIVLHFRFRSVINFELIFVKGVRSVSRFTFLHVDVQLFQHHLLKRLSLLRCIVFMLLSKMSWPYLCGSISGLSILFHWSIHLFFFPPIHIGLNYCSFIVGLEVSSVSPSALFFSFNIMLAILGVLLLHVNFIIHLLNPQNYLLYFDWDYI